MMRIFTIAAVLMLWVGAASAQQTVDGKFVFYNKAGVIHLVDIDIRVIPPPGHPEIPREGEYRINRTTGALSLAERVAFRFCEWFWGSPVRSHPAISRALGTVGPAGRFLADLAHGTSRVIRACERATGGSQ